MGELTPVTPLTLLVGSSFSSRFRNVRHAWSYSKLFKNAPIANVMLYTWVCHCIPDTIRETGCLRLTITCPAPCSSNLRAIPRELILPPFSVGVHSVHRSLHWFLMFIHCKIIQSPTKSTKTPTHLCTATHLCTLSCFDT